MGCGASKPEENCQKYSAEQPAPKPAPKPAPPPAPAPHPKLAQIKVMRHVPHPMLAIRDAPPAIPDGTIYSNKTVYRYGEPIVVYYNLTSMLSPSPTGYGQCTMYIGHQDWSMPQKWFSVPTQQGVQTQLFTFNQGNQLDRLSNNYSLFFIELFGQEERMLNFSTTWVDGWYSIGAGYSNLTVAMSDAIFANDAAGNIMQYQGLPAWAKVGDPVYKMVGNHDALFTIPSTKDKVMRYDLASQQWSQVGGAIALETLVASHTYLFGLTAAGNAYFYTGTAWQDLGQQLSQLIASDDFRVCGVSLDRTKVMHYQGTPGQWMSMGSVAMTSLLAANNAMYGIDGSGNLQRWDGTTSTWEIVGAPGGTYLSRHNAVFQVTADKSAVYVFTGLPGQWIQMCGQIDSLAIGENFLFGLRGSTVMAFEYDGDIPEVDPPQPAGVTRAAAPALVAARPNTRPAAVRLTTTTNTKWIFTFNTLDEVRAGYDGNVQFLVNDTTGVSKMTLLPTTHFERGHSYTWQFDLGSIGTLTNMGVAASSNFWGDQWHLGTVTAFCEATGVVYTFTYNGQVPNLPSSQFNLVQLLPVGEAYGWMVNATSFTPPAPTGQVATINIWSYRGLTDAVGHASLQLSDGTYMSWWPSGYDRKTIPFIGLALHAPQINPQPFSQDKALEGQDPDFTVPIFIPNEAAAKTWWNGFNVNGNYWNAVTQNCSTVVYWALKQGNALRHLSPAQVRAYDGIVTWTPNDVLDLANDIKMVG